MRSTKPQRSPAPDTVNGRSGLDGVVLPTEYRSNVERALAYDPELASTYLRHTLIGDPLMDDMAEEFAPVPQADLTQFIHAGMEQDVEAMRAAPKVLRDFFIDYPPPDPPWLDYEDFAPGIRAFHRDSGLILSGFAAGVLVDGFGTLIAKSFVLTGRVFDTGVRRLRQNNRHFLEVFFPRRAGKGRGRLEAIRPHPVHSRSDAAPAVRLRGVGHGGLGRSHKRGAYRLRRRLFLRADNQTLGVHGRFLHPGGAGQHHGHLALHRLHHGDT